MAAIGGIFQLVASFIKGGAKGSGDAKMEHGVQNMSKAGYVKDPLSFSAAFEEANLGMEALGIGTQKKDPKEKFLNDLALSEISRTWMLT